MKSIFQILTSCILVTVFVFGLVYILRDKRPHSDFYKSQCEPVTYGVKYRVVKAPDPKVGTFLILKPNPFLHHKYTIKHTVVMDIWGFKSYRDGDAHEHYYPDLGTPPKDKDAVQALVEMLALQGGVGDPDTATIMGLVTGRFAALKELDSEQPSDSFHYMFANVCTNTKNINEFLILGTADKFVSGDIYKYVANPPKANATPSPTPTEPDTDQPEGDVHSILYGINNF